ncbi:MAG: hypothetical protein AAB582_03650 [Patescibacteria group bacterium]
MKKLTKIVLQALAADLTAVIIGFGVVYVLNPFYTGDIIWLYMIGLVVGLGVWIAGHAMAASFMDKK